MAVCGGCKFFYKSYCQINDRAVGVYDPACEWFEN